MRVKECSQNAFHRGWRVGIPHKRRVFLSVWGVVVKGSTFQAPPLVGGGGKLASFQLLHLKMGLMIVLTLEDCLQGETAPVLMSGTRHRVKPFG